MENRELYRHVLELEKAWQVGRAQLDVRQERVDIWAVYEEGQSWSYPERGINLSVYDHVPGLAWPRLDTCQFKGFIDARIPRMECPTHEVR
jgi:transposase